MNKEIIGSFNVNPLEIIKNLTHCRFNYPSNSETEQYRGWSNFPAIPALYNWTVENSRPPRSEEGVNFLLDNADDNVNIKSIRIIKRAQKLYMDWCREMHTLGLLQNSNLFSFVSYQKALDMESNVDYLVCLLSVGYNYEKVGIQSAMRCNWNNETWCEVKEKRSKRRGDKSSYNGSIYWLTNRVIKHDFGPNGCWLFNENHIKELAKEIKTSSKKNETNDGKINFNKLRGLFANE